MEESPGKRNPAASFTDDILVEILSRLPVRSVCRFKCVSRSWRNLITHPDHRKKLPQTLAGFFYESFNYERSPIKAHHFTNVTGTGRPFISPSFSFLPVSNSDVVLLDSCDGLILCRCFLPGPPVGGHRRPFHYAVCNPATEKWVMLPDGSWDSGEARTARLCFDPAVSSHFHVIEYVEEDDEDGFLTGVEIYSSKTGSWSHVESGWGDTVTLCAAYRQSVFLNGFLHSVTISDGIAAVDMEGKTWRTIRTPSNEDHVFSFIHRAQSSLCLINVDDDDIFKLRIWSLEDYGTDKWILKHTVSTLHLFGGQITLGDLENRVIAIHPEGNMIFFVFGWDNILMAYIMDRREVRIIRDLGHECSDPYLSYVPLFSESPVDGQ